MHLHCCYSQPILQRSRLQRCISPYLCLSVSFCCGQKIKDQSIGTLLKEIRVYLPTLRRDGGATSNDLLPHPSTLIHLRRRFNHVSSSLLRNDSLTDMSDRSVLYFELFEWLEVCYWYSRESASLIVPLLDRVLVQRFKAETVR